MCMHVCMQIFRLEQVNIKKRYGVAKVVGTVGSIVGATVITLYKGPPLLTTHPHLTLAAITSSSQILNWTLGCVYMLGNCLGWSGWMVLQVRFDIHHRTGDRPKQAWIETVNLNKHVILLRL